MATHDTRKDETMADEAPKLERWEEEQLAAIARDAVAVVRNKMLHQHAAEAERDKARARAEAAVKRAEGAERGAVQWRKVAEGLERELDQAREANARLVNRIHDIRQLVGGEEDLVEGIRALKARCNNAEREAKLAKGTMADGCSEAAAARIRAGVAEAALAERSQHVVDWQTSAENWEREAASLRDRIQEYEVAFAAINLALDGCDTRLDADKVVAKIRALKDQRDDSEADCMTAQAEQERLEREVASLQAQVDRLQGWDGSVWIARANEQRQRAERRCAAFVEILNSIAGLSFSKSQKWKSGRWKCRSCGRTVDIRDETLTAFQTWWWSEVTWKHACSCYGNTIGQSDRIGDCPEVTP